MSKRRYYKSKRVYPKQKWLPVNNEITCQQYNGLTTGSFVIRYEPITQNATRTNTAGAGNQSSATIIKTGRFRYRGQIYTNSAITYIVGIAYVPEGYDLNANVNIARANLGETFFYKHPEWILAWTRLDYVGSSGNNEIRLSSKLKRNLNSGDGIVLFYIAINYGTDTVNASQVAGTVSYVCRTN